jgi:hypothetical protein
MVVTADSARGGVDGDVGRTYAAEGKIDAMVLRWHM